VAGSAAGSVDDVVVAALVSEAPESAASEALESVVSDVLVSTVSVVVEDVALATVV
jgi:hypothetical protein